MANVKYFCVDCMRSYPTRNDLNCNEHTICQRCLMKRLSTSRQLQCTVCQVLCSFDEYDSPNFDEDMSQDASKKDIDSHKDEKEPQMTSTEANFGIWIFVDDSNIWIEAKKLQGQLKGFASEDDRVRIDIGKLTDLIAAGRSVRQGILYGSEPPKVDSVWNKIRKQGWEVVKLSRSKITGKEKQVDTKLVASVTSTAIKTPKEERSTIVIVTGDADVKPALEEVMKEANWTVEIYMWEHAIARILKKYKNEHKERINITYLNVFLNKATFINRKFPDDKKLKRKVAIVLTMYDRQDPEEEWWGKVDKIAKWPSQYRWFDADSRNLELIFSRKSNGNSFDVEQFLSDLKDHYQQLGIRSAEKIMEFKSNREKNAQNGNEDSGWTLVLPKRSSPHYRPHCCKYMQQL